jgi:hypothetical protein
MDWGVSHSHFLQWNPSATTTYGVVNFKQNQKTIK